jgi:GDP-L-fucose synthase
MNTMNEPVRPSSRIYVAGHCGLVGSALVQRLRAAGYENLLLRTREQVDLADTAQVERFFAESQPEYVILAAAKVGGILANNNYPADFIVQNLHIETNVITAAHRHAAKRLLFLGSSCIYPRDCPQPIREEFLLTGPLEFTNRAYAIAKIAGVEMCWSYNRQHRTSFLAAMPTNLYGPDDNYDPVTSHVIPGLIRKMHDAKARGATEVELWGTGKPLREFLFSHDAADACLHLLSLPPEALRKILESNTPPIINVGSGEEISILELAKKVAQTVGFQGRLRFDTTKPDGTLRKLLDSSRLHDLGWSAATSLDDGLQKTYTAFLDLHNGNGRSPAPGLTRTGTGAEAPSRTC